MSHTVKRTLICFIALAAALIAALTMMRMADAADTTAPDTTITSKPANPSGPNVSFGFSSNESNVVFKCNLDGAGFSTCTSPQSYSGLSDGAHRFVVKARDAAGNVDSSPASYDWTVGSAPPPPPPPPAGNVGVGTGSAADCTKVVSPGSQTLANAASGTGGGTICLRQGVYGGLGVTNKISGSGTSSKRLVVKSYPGERAEFRGQMTMSNASYLTVRDMYFNNRYQLYSGGGGVTNGGNPDMTPTVLMGGNHILFTNNEIDGGNGDASAASGTRPMNERSTPVGYRNPGDDHFVRNWVHNAGVLAKYSKDGKADGHAIYFSNANGAGPHEFSDNVLWGVPDDSNAIDLHGMSVGPVGYDVMNNVVFASSDTIDMNNQNRDSHIAHNILIDPDGEPIRYDQGQGNNVIEDNCMNGDIKVNSSANLTVRNNVIDRSASVTGTPKSSTWTINASSACLGKYQGTMYR